MGLHKQRMASVMSLPRGAALRGGASATPASLASLVAWGEGSDLGADGTSIASWLNKTLSGLDPAQGTGANQPTVVANAINGQKAARFTSASSQVLLFPAGALGWCNNVTGFTMAAVVQFVSVAANASPLFVSANSSASTPRVGLQMIAAGPRWQAIARRLDADGPASPNIASPAPTVAVPVILTGTADPAGAGNAMLSLNSGLLATAAMVSTGNFAATNSLAISVGSNGSNSQPCDAYIAAYAMWNVAYTAAQIRPVLNRWAGLYGITLTG